MYTTSVLALALTLAAVSPQVPNKPTTTNSALELTSLVCKSDIACTVQGSCPTDKGIIYFGINPRSVIITADVLNLLLFDIGKNGYVNQYAQVDKPQVRFSIDELLPDDRESMRTVYRLTLGLLIDCARRGVDQHAPIGLVPDHPV